MKWEKVNFEAFSENGALWSWDDVAKQKVPELSVVMTNYSQLGFLRLCITVCHFRALIYSLRVYNRPENLSNSVKKRKIRAITLFKVIQGHRGRYQSKACMRFPIMWLTVTDILSRTVSELSQLIVQISHQRGDFDSSVRLRRYERK